MARIDALMLVVVPARCGSTRLPGKNFRIFEGRPLYLRALEQACRFGGASRIVFSSDAEAAQSPIPEQVIRHQRSAELASDQASSQDLAQVLWNEYGEGCRGLMWLQPTSPLRHDNDLLLAMNLWAGQGSVVSVCEGPADHPYARGLDATGRLGPELTGETVVLNGAIYILDSATIESGDWIQGAQALIMPANRSVDIDTAEDWDKAVSRLEQGDGELSS